MTNLGSLGLLLFCTATDGANLRLCEHALARAETLGIKCQLLNIATVKLPLFVSFEGEKPDPEIMDPLIETFTQATGFFFAAPEYNGLIPPSLVNLITWLSIEGDDFRAMFNNKPAVIGTHSGGPGNKALMAMRMQFSHLGVNVLGRELAAKNGEDVAESSIDDVLKRLQPML